MPVIPLTTAQIRASLRSGYSLDPADQFTYSIPGAGSTWETTDGNYDIDNPQPTTGYSTFDATQAANFVAAITAWDDLIDPDFVAVADDISGHGEVRGAFTSHNMGGGTAGYAFQGSNQTPTSLVGDVWINSNSTGATFAYGTADYQTFLHEVGHVLGLKHSFVEKVGDVPIPAPYETTRYTVLSYTPGSQLVTFEDQGGGFVGSTTSGVTVATPMVLDIAYVQDLYGADTETRSGDNTYAFNQNDAFLQSIYDAGGTDTFDLSTITRSNVIDLNPGAYSSVAVFSRAEQSAYWQGQFGAGFAGFFDGQLAPAETYTWNDNVGIAFTTTIENVIGGAGNDTITGNRAQNQMRGNGGNDTMDAGVGLDSALFSGDSSAYNWTVARGQTQITGTDGSDFLVGFEMMEFENASYEFDFADGFDASAFTLAGFGADAGDWDDNATYQRVLADVDGNGRPDIVGFGNDGVYVSLSSGAGFAAAYLGVVGFGASAGAGGWTGTDTRSLADINGDGRADIVGFGDEGVWVSLATGSGAFGATFLANSGFGGNASAGGWSTDDPRALADVNGDGRADVVGFGDGGVYVSLANTDGTFGAAQQGTFGFGSSVAAGGWSSATHLRTLADVDGDGLADVVGFGENGTWVALATGTGTFGTAFQATFGFGASALSGGWSDNNLLPRVLADLNSDGRADIVGFAADGTRVALAQADGTFAAPYKASDEFGSNVAAGGWTSNDLAPRMVADFNGDGLADIVGFGDSGVFVAYGDGLGDFADSAYAVSGYGSDAAAGGWTSQSTTPRLLADLTNDGVADIVGFASNGVFTTTSTGDWVLVV